MNMSTSLAVALSLLIIAAGLTNSREQGVPDAKQQPLIDSSTVIYHSNNVPEYAQ